MPAHVDQSRTPYFDVLLDYVDSGVIPFHTPGHMQGKGMDRALRDFLGDNILAIDLTQIRGLDDLLQPEYAIQGSARTRRRSIRRGSFVLLDQRIDQR